MVPETRGLRVLTTCCASIVLAATIGCAAIHEDGRDKKAWSGVSYLKSTHVELQAQPSAAVAGFDSERVWSGYDDWEPALATDPNSSWVYQMTTRYSGPKACNGCPFPVIVFRSSSNGGATWGPDRFLTISKNPQNDPMMEVASDGTIYAAWLDDYTPGVKFLKSSDHGVTWSTPVAFTGRKKTPTFSDRPVLAISPDGRDVYLAFNASDSYVAASHDFGATWGPNVKTNNDTRYCFQTGGAVAPNGDVYFITTDFTQDYTGDAFISILRSVDGGASWTTTRLDTSRQMADCPWAAGCYFGFLGSSAALAIDRSGNLLAVSSASDTPGGAARIYARTSSNGTTWSARQLLSASTANGNFPAAAAGPTAGDFRVTFQDDRNGFTTAWNTWLRTTQNGGSTWTAAARLSDLGSGAPYKSAAGYRFPYGDYYEIAVDNAGVNHVIWGEGISYTGPGGTWYTRGN
jgi:hypothetical protein